MFWVGLCTVLLDLAVVGIKVSSLVVFKKVLMKTLFHVKKPEWLFERWAAAVHFVEGADFIGVVFVVVETKVVSIEDVEDVEECEAS